jgi:DnaJ-class molecular chaperone
VVMAGNMKREIGRMKPCPECNATGAAPVRDSKGRPHAGRDLSKSCETCGGTGYVPDLAGEG